MNRRIYRRNRKAVAPVLATLLMIAVAVAMSVIIFMWSQGFLAQTSESTGSQQGAQNQAAQSSISIETATLGKSTNGNSTNIIVRNVGSVSISIGSVTISGIKSNVGFSGSVTALASNGGIANASVTPTSGTWYSLSGSGLNNVAKGSAVTLKFISTLSSGDTVIRSGDVITIKVTTDKGTFAQQSYTVQ